VSGGKFRPEAIHPEDPLRWAKFHPPAKWYSERHEVAAVAVLNRVKKLSLKDLEPVKPDPPDVKCTLAGKPIGVEVTAGVQGELAKMQPLQATIGRIVRDLLPGVNGTLFLSSADPSVSHLSSKEIRADANTIAVIIERLSRRMLIGSSEKILAPELQRAGVLHFNRIVFSVQAAGGIRTLTARWRRERSLGFDELTGIVNRKAGALSRWSISPAERWLLIVASVFTSNITIEGLHDGWTPVTGTGFSRIYYVDVSDLPGREEGMRLDHVD